MKTNGQSTHVVPRHAAAMETMQEAATRLPSDVKHIVIVYDGPHIMAWERKASYASDAPVSDVAAICKALADQLS